MRSAVFDPGAIGKLGTVVYYEHTIARQYAETLALALRQTYERTAKLLIATREAPLNLALRKRYEPHADVFVSIHLNASTNAFAEGYEVWYYTDESRELAQVLLDACGRALEGMVNRGIKRNAFTVLTRARPSALVELGFITNPRDLARLVLPTTRQAWARATATALHAYLQARGE